MSILKKIIHVDMDAFFASVEQMDNPNLRGKPVAVGGNKERGVVAAASYEARKYGVRSAMPSKIAIKKCPDLIFIKPRFERYRELSLAIRKIFFDYTDLVEPLSLDEAFLDVTENHFNIPSATMIAKEIRARIKKEIGLNASAGISYNKFLAKVASDLNKPDGQAVITPEKSTAFLEKLPIEKFYGIGKVTTQKMKGLGIHHGLDLKQYTLSFLTKRFGKAGLHYYEIVRGIQNSEVKPNRIRKSLGVEKTFEMDLVALEEFKDPLEALLAELILRMEKAKVRGRTMTLKIKFNNFTQQTRSKSLSKAIAKQEMSKITFDLLYQSPIALPVRLLGLAVSNLITEETQSPPGGGQLKINY